MKAVGSITASDTITVEQAASENTVFEFLEFDRQPVVAGAFVPLGGTPVSFDRDCV
jgi:hypothetical protein